MKVIIHNCNHPYYKQDGVIPIHIWLSPDQSHAVIEALQAEYFMVGKIQEYDEDNRIMTFVCKDSISADNDDVDYHGYSIDWSCSVYGFCKVKSISLESGEKRSFRLYFDAELYKEKYEEENGVSYNGCKKFD